LDCHGAAGHSKEVKFFLAQLLNPLTRQNTLYALLNEKCRSIFLLFSSLLFDESFTDLLVELLFDALLLKGLDHKHDTVTTLATSLVLLYQTDSIRDAKLNGEWILDDFSLGLS
jgi:hypothetical protein